MRPFANLAAYIGMRSNSCNFMAHDTCHHNIFAGTTFLQGRHAGKVTSIASRSKGTCWDGWTLINSPQYCLVHKNLQDLWSLGPAQIRPSTFQAPGMTRPMARVRSLALLLGAWTALTFCPSAPPSLRVLSAPRAPRARVARGNRLYDCETGIYKAETNIKAWGVER